MSDIRISQKIVQPTANGQYEPKLFSRGDFGYSFRYDLYTSKRDPGPPVMDMILCNDQNDLSPVYTGPYDAKCSCCWLGYGHTEAHHNKSINNHE
ncbi:MAG: hypothetical protein PHT07_24025 [Paludibacter sp.]|nr:hypothetical protein [Paludibacter sp.]